MTGLGQYSDRRNERTGIMQSTILVVDDDQNTVDILTHLLTRHGMTVLPACNGLEGVVNLFTRIRQKAEG